MLITDTTEAAPGSKKQRQLRELEYKQVRESRVSQMRKYARTVRIPDARVARLQRLGMPDFNSDT